MRQLQQNRLQADNTHGRNAGEVAEHYGESVYC
jgi:hypothetical protein